MNDSKIVKKKIKVDSFDELLGLDTFGHNVQKLYPVEELRLDELKEFPNHPFKVTDDDKMRELVESITSYGLFHPGIAVRDFSGGYFIVSGHRRARAMRLAGKESMPFRVIDTDMETARVVMVDSNFQQRDSILPSEKAKAYMQKYTAIKRQGKQGGGNSLEEIGEIAGESGKTVQRYIRLSFLSDELLELVDSKKLGIVQGINISFLDSEDQKAVLNAIKETGVCMTQKQAIKIREAAERGELLEEMVTLILMDQRKPVKKDISFSSEVLARFFSKEATKEEMERVIIGLLEDWKGRS